MESSLRLRRRSLLDFGQAFDIGLYHSLVIFTNLAVISRLIGLFPPTVGPR
jgi:hypothetical protein